MPFRAQQGFASEGARDHRPVWHSYWGEGHRHWHSFKTQPHNKRGGEEYPKEKSPSLFSQLGWERFVKKKVVLKPSLCSAEQEALERQHLCRQTV